MIVMIPEYIIVSPNYNFADGFINVV